VALTNPLFDEWGVIHDATKRLPNVAMKVAFLEALGELEDHECHRTRKFPRTRLHKVVGYKQPVYRADIDKISGWRIHMQYEGGQNSPERRHRRPEARRCVGPDRGKEDQV
jgi:hypothetical protein